MSEQHEFDHEGNAPRRRSKEVRSRAPRASRTTESKKKRPSGFGGAHRRRNKHWNW